MARTIFEGEESMVVQASNGRGRGRRLEVTPWGGSGVLVVSEPDDVRACADELRALAAVMDGWADEEQGRRGKSGER